MSEVPCLMSEVPRLTSEVPRLMSEVPRLTSEVSRLMSEVPCLPGGAYVRRGGGEQPEPSRRQGDQGQGQEPIYYFVLGGQLPRV